MKACKLMMPLFAVVSLSLTSCLHKDLSYDDSRRADIYVDFDWSNAQDAAPTSMLTYFFPAGGDVLEYTFAGRDGGQIALPVGTTYCAISINGDNTYWAGMRHTDDPDRFENPFTPPRCRHDRRTHCQDSRHGLERSAG